jgi:hypothetical protein
MFPPYYRIPGYVEPLSNLDAFAGGGIGTEENFSHKKAQVAQKNKLGGLRVPQGKNCNYERRECTRIRRREKCGAEEEVFTTEARRHRENADTEEGA